jgi:HAMP domain-containing protein
VRPVNKKLPIAKKLTDHPFFKRRGRIVFTLLAVLVLIGLAPLAAVAWKLIDINREALSTAQREYRQLLRVAQTMSGAIRRQGYEPQGELRRVLDDVLDERMLYLRYTYFREKDSSSISAGELPEQLDPVFGAGLQEAVQILSRDASARGQMTIISDPILLDTHPRRPVLVVSAPVVSRGRFRGVLSALVDLSVVWEAVVGRNTSGHVIYILDDTGRVIASNAPASIVPGTNANRTVLVVRYLSPEGRGQETMPFIEIEDGVEQSYIGSYEATGLGWGVFVQARLRDVYAPVRHMVDSITTWALFVLALAALAAVVFARTLSNPIKRLAAASRAFARGDFSTRVSVRSGNEIGELAFTFNTMAGEIEDQFRRLKEAAEENKELFLGTIRALAQAIDAKDPYTRGHSVRVNRYSIVLARQLGMNDDQIADIHVASLMHDVGKIGINDKILQKPGKLTADEFGADQIPLMARVIAVADAFDAMTTHRPYQTAMSFAKAQERLNMLKGLAFDERIVEAFNRAYQQGQIAPEPGNNLQVAGQDDTTISSPSAIVASMSETAS